VKESISLIKSVLSTGRWKSNRTGIKTISAPGQILKFDLQEGFPAITTRKLPFKTGNAELVGFLRASRSAELFRSLGCKVWDQNANENAQWLDNPYRLGHDDLGAIYGVQWRKWPAYKQVALKDKTQRADATRRGYVEIARRWSGGEEIAVLYKEIDQVRECLDKIMYSPDDRRILFHAWNPAELDAMALPPCHLLYQFHADADSKELSLTLYIRSNDIGLGNPLNISEAAVMLSLFARLTGYTPRHLCVMIGDAHIYENHLGMIQEQLAREPLARPRLVISDRIPEFAVTGRYEPEWLDKVEPGDFVLDGYQHHAVITAPMAV
jgi:thymidylate synthase